MSNHNPILCIVGPTASGKTALSQRLAVFYHGEVVSADSMQVYRGMDIGTAKIPAHERVVPHHGFDLVNPGEPYSAALFQEYARECFREIQDRGNIPVLCGGTGFYVRAAIDGYDFPQGEQVDNPIRERYQLIAQEQGALAVWEELKSRDAKSAEVIAPNDLKRVIRALELLEEGVSYAEQKERLAHIPQVVPAIMIGIKVEPELLAARIDQRVDAMFEDGLIEEVKGLLNEGFRDGITAPQAIGYKEVVAALDGAITMEEAKEQIKTATRRYAKRQRTWFRKDARIQWVDGDSFDGEQLFSDSCRIIDKVLNETSR